MFLNWMFLKSTAFRLTTFATALAAAFLIVNQSPTFGQYGEVAPPPAELKVGYDSITADQAREWLGVLAGPKFQGRGTGQPGYTKAAHWVAGKLAEFGLEPVGDNGTYFQMLPMERRMAIIDECFLEGPDGLKIAARDQIGFESYKSQQETSGNVVFLKFTGETAEIPSDLQLRDKVVVFESDGKAVKSALTQLSRKRPVASIRLIDTLPRSIPQLVGGRSRGGATVYGTMVRSAALQLLKSCGGMSDWFDQAGEGVKVLQTESNVTLRMRFQVEKAAVPNVVARLEGSDPKLKDEYVVIGSHLDHLGIQNGVVHLGADDNGSGSTAVLSIAKAYSMNPVRPKRSLLFLWFAAEEIGLVGSDHYTKNPTLPLEGMTCMFNMDMVGRNEETRKETAEENEGSIHLVGSQKGETDLHNLILEANQHVGFRFELDEERVWNRSDQIHFYDEGVPVAFLFGGFHPDYHQPSDQPDKINYKKIASAGRLYYLAIQLASEHGRFKSTAPDESGGK